VPAFDAETLLPEALRAWIMDEAERMPCPPDFIVAAALVALGSIVGIPRSRASEKGATHELAGTRAPRNSEKRPPTSCQ
jgi:hypothetical protein